MFTLNISVKDQVYCNMNNQTNKFEETLNGKIDDSELIQAPWQYFKIQKH